MIKSVGGKFVIIGHSENRLEGDSNKKINLKIKSSLKENLKVIFCIGENLKEKRNKKTNKILNSQIINGLKNVKNLNNIIVAYEPIWAIGTGIIPKSNDLYKQVKTIKKILNKRFKSKNPKVLYGGSVNSKNIKDLRQIRSIDGFLIGGASQKSKNFILRNDITLQIARLANSRLKHKTRPSDAGTYNLLSNDMQAEAYTDAPTL